MHDLYEGGVPETYTIRKRDGNDKEVYKSIESQWRRPRNEFTVVEFLQNDLIEQTDKQTDR